MKTIGQVTLTSSNPVTNILGSFNVAERLFQGDGLKVLYRGFVPFVAMSVLAPYYLPKVWSKDLQETTLTELKTRYSAGVSEYNGSFQNY